jgi:MoaA/NifB/PqqE/SkfB family radical SAM enzyme
MEVMVNGDVVLCCDDAERYRVYGNVFESSIEEIWNGPLLEEHKVIYSRQFLAEKQDLICTGCSRAVYGREPLASHTPLKPLGGLSEVLKQTLRGNATHL